MLPSNIWLLFKIQLQFKVFPPNPKALNSNTFKPNDGIQNWCTLKKPTHWHFFCGHNKEDNGGLYLLFGCSFHNYHVYTSCNRAKLSRQSNSVSSVGFSTPTQPPRMLPWIRSKGQVILWTGEAFWRIPFDNCFDRMSSVQGPGYCTVLQTHN